MVRIFTSRKGAFFFCLFPSEGLPNFMTQFTKLGAWISPFLEVKIRTIIYGLNNDLLTSFAGEKDKRDVFEIPSYLFEELYAVHYRHLVIRHNGINHSLCKDLQTFPGRRNRDNREFPLPFKKKFTEIEQIRLVIYVKERNHYFLLLFSQGFSFLFKKDFFVVYFVGVGKKKSVFNSVILKGLSFVITCNSYC